MKAHRRALIVLGLVVALLLAGWVGWAVADSRSGGQAEHLRLTKFGQMLESGQLQSMLEQHQQMMELMRMDASQQMRRRMDADPMWKLMRNDDFTQMMEAQQRQINRMLGRGAP